MSEATIWIPGATGFVGRALMAHLQSLGRRAIPVSRQPGEVLGEKTRNVSDLAGELVPGDVVIYAAGLAHCKPSATSKEAYHRANCDEPLAVARLAAARGAARFVFISSIKVNGERTEGVPFNGLDVPQPEDEYGRSKWEGEQALAKHAFQTGMEMVVVRPPLVYGPNVKANFQTMMRWLERGVPLPLASIENKRSFLYLGNLVDFLEVCSRHPAAVDEVFTLSDGRDLSTPELLRMMGGALGQPARLWHCPVPLLKAGAQLIGRRALADRLCDSLQVSSDKARNRLVWQPPFSVEEGLRVTAGDGE